MFSNVPIWEMGTFEDVYDAIKSFEEIFIQCCVLLKIIISNKNCVLKRGPL